VSPFDSGARARHISLALLFWFRFCLREIAGAIVM
jgi:hypothetical protein